MSYDDVHDSLAKNLELIIKTHHLDQRVDDSNMELTEVETDVSISFEKETISARRQLKNTLKEVLQRDQINHEQIENLDFRLQRRYGDELLEKTPFTEDTAETVRLPNLDEAVPVYPVLAELIREVQTELERG
jgi:hypothetical protein